MIDLSRNTHRLRLDAVRVGLGFAVAGLLFLVTASLWMGTCTGSTADGLACGAPQRALAALGTPAILLAGAVWSLMRGLRGRRDHTWLATGSALLVLMVLSVAVAV